MNFLEDSDLFGAEGVLLDNSFYGELEDDFGPLQDIAYAPEQQQPSAYAEPAPPPIVEEEQKSVYIPLPLQETPVPVPTFDELLANIAQEAFTEEFWQTFHEINKFEEKKFLDFFIDAKLPETLMSGRQPLERIHDRERVNENALGFFDYLQDERVCEHLRSKGESRETREVVERAFSTFLGKPYPEFLLQKLDSNLSREEAERKSLIVRENTHFVAALLTCFLTGKNAFAYAPEKASTSRYGAYLGEWTRWLVHSINALGYTALDESSALAGYQSIGGCEREGLQPWFDQVRSVSIAFVWMRFVFDELLERVRQGVLSRLAAFDSRVQSAVLADLDDDSSLGGQVKRICSALVQFYQAGLGMGYVTGYPALCVPSALEEFGYASLFEEFGAELASAIARDVYTRVQRSEEGLQKRSASPSPDDQSGKRRKPSALPSFESASVEIGEEAQPNLYYAKLSESSGTNGMINPIELFALRNLMSAALEQRNRATFAQWLSGRAAFADPIAKGLALETWPLDTLSAADLGLGYSESIAMHHGYETMHVWVQSMAKRFVLYVLGDSDAFPLDPKRTEDRRILALKETLDLASDAPENIVSSFSFRYKDWVVSDLSNITMRREAQRAYTSTRLSRGPGKVKNLGASLLFSLLQQPESPQWLCQSLERAQTLLGDILNESSSISVVQVEAAGQGVRESTVSLDYAGFAALYAQRANYFPYKPIRWLTKHDFEDLFSLGDRYSVYSEPEKFKRELLRIYEDSTRQSEIKPFGAMFIIPGDYIESRGARLLSIAVAMIKKFPRELIQLYLVVGMVTWRNITRYHPSVLFGILEALDLFLDPATLERVYAAVFRGKKALESGAVYDLVFNAWANANKSTLGAATLSEIEKQLRVAQYLAISREKKLSGETEQLRRYFKVELGFYQAKSDAVENLPKDRIWVKLEQSPSGPRNVKQTNPIDTRFTWKLERLDHIDAKLSSAKPKGQLRKPKKLQGKKRPVRKIDQAAEIVKKAREAYVSTGDSQALLRAVAEITAFKGLQRKQEFIEQLTGLIE